jgi:hypothetical protein
VILAPIILLPIVLPISHLTILAFDYWYNQARRTSVTESSRHSPNAVAAAKQRLPHQKPHENEHRRSPIVSHDRRFHHGDGTRSDACYFP